MPVGRLTLPRVDRRRSPRRSPMPARAERLRVELDAHGVLLRAEDLHLGHAAARSRCAGRGTSRRTRRASTAAAVGECSARNRIGVSDGFDLAVATAACMSCGRLPRPSARSRPARPAPRRRCRGRATNCSVMLRRAQAAGRGHRVDAGDRRELLLERRGHRRGHRLGARAGQVGAHRDRRDSRRSAGRSPAAGGRRAMPKRRMPIITSVVVTGRRIHGAERFIAPPPPPGG